VSGPLLDESFESVEVESMPDDPVALCYMLTNLAKSQDEVLTHLEFVVGNIQEESEEHQNSTLTLKKKYDIVQAENEQLKNEINGLRKQLRRGIVSRLLGR